MKIILASQSPRRRELLTLMGIRDFEIIPAAGEETPGSDPRPEKIVTRLARQKAEEVARSHPEALVIAADTLVFLDGVRMGKPKDRADAGRMLHRLSGRSHQVYSGVCVSCGGKTLTEYEGSSVVFRRLSDGEIDAYIATGEPMDKAGAYGIQGRGAMLVQQIEGDFFNIMGLPVCRLYLMLKQFGIDLLKVYE